MVTDRTTRANCSWRMEKCLQANFQAGAYATCAGMRFRARALSTLPSKHTQKFLVAKSPADLHFDISNAI